MNVIKHYTRLRCPRLPDNVSENHTSLGRGYFDRRFNAVESVRAERVRGGSLDEFDIAESGEFDAEILEGVSCLVHD